MRREITAGLIKAANSYWLHKRFSCHNELAIAKWGKRRVDVIAVNLKSELVIVEVKSGLADYRSDKKWETYLEACHKFYFCMTEKTARLLECEFDHFKKLGVGVLALDPTSGYLRVLVNAKTRPMKGSMHKHIVTRLAWRNGDKSRRNSRRVRVYLEENDNGKAGNTP